MQEQHSPSYRSVLYNLQIVFFASVLLYFGKTLFIPLFLGLLIAIILFPVCKWLEQHKISKSIAITICLLIVAILFSMLLALLVWQINVFSQEAPDIYSRLTETIQEFQTWLSDHLQLSFTSADEWKKDILPNIGTLAQSTVAATTNTLFILFLTPVYTALFLYHRKTFVHYLQLVVPAKYHAQLNSILHETVHTYFNYIKGMIAVYIIVGILNSAGLLVLGVKHAILFGMLCAFMTIIPYIGIIVSSLLPISMIWIQTGNFWYPLAVIAIFGFVQYLEANVIFPKVVGTQLHVSTLSMLIAIIAGGIIWGVAGMVLFIPFVAIAKIISGNIDEWKPLYLLLSRD